MTTSERRAAPPGADAARPGSDSLSQRPAVRDVVAGMVDGVMAVSVARAAVREAVARGARVRFLQVLPDGLTPEERAVADETTFAAALRALREAPRVPVTFETVEGDVASLFVQRSTNASVLVIAHEDAEDDAVTAPAGLASYCRAHCRCDVMTVMAER